MAPAATTTPTTSTSSPPRARRSSSPTERSRTRRYASPLLHQRVPLGGAGLDHLAERQAGAAHVELVLLELTEVGLHLRGGDDAILQLGDRLGARVPGDQQL